MMEPNELGVSVPYRDNRRVAGKLIIEKLLKDIERNEAAPNWGILYSYHAPDPVTNPLQKVLLNHAALHLTDMARVMESFYAIMRGQANKVPEHEFAKVYLDLMFQMNMNPFYSSYQPVLAPHSHSVMGDYMAARAAEKQGSCVVDSRAVEDEFYIRYVPAIVYAATGDFTRQMTASQLIREDLAKLPK